MDRRKVRDFMKSQGKVRKILDAGILF